jgi:energy-coupling factor transporter ATP-binding protein EcfA2
MMANRSQVPDSVRRELGFVSGREFVLDAPTTVPANWGAGREVLWAAGEPLLICGPQGVGKSTLLQQLALARIGIGPSDFLGYSVAPADARALYIAADRPRQIARSLRRMVSDEDAQLLSDGLIVWPGPLPFDLAKHPERLAEWVLESGATDVFADSLKDLCSPLSSDEVGSAYNRAVAGVIAAGVEFAANHHQRKATGENKPSASSRRGSARTGSVRQREPSPACNRRRNEAQRDAASGAARRCRSGSSDGHQPEHHPQLDEACGHDRTAGRR